MKEPIYNAIQKQLVIDDDSSIGYIHSTMNNAFVKKVTLNELYTIFSENYSDKYVFDHNNISNIFKYDTTDCLTLITIDGQEISLHEYDFYKYHPRFAKIFTPEMANAGNEVIIDMYTSHVHMATVYQTKSGTALSPMDVDDAKRNFSGYDNTAEILANIIKHRAWGKASAASYCTKVEVPLQNGDVYQGFLPSAGQMVFIEKYRYLINYVFARFGRDFSWFHKYRFWTSNERDQNNAYTSLYGHIYYNQKQGRLNVMPLFKKIN